MLTYLSLQERLFDDTLKFEFANPAYLLMHPACDPR